MHLSHDQERGLVSFLFISYGIGIMSWIPRFPDIKNNLGVSNGEFGTLISLGSLGAVIALLTVGHLVHRFGAKTLFISISTLLYASFIAIVFVRSPWLFLILNIIVAFGASAFHVVVNGQAFLTQERQDRHLITAWHGMWSGGAMIGAIASGFLIGRVSVEVHISVVAVLAWVSTLICVLRLGNHLVQPLQASEEPVKFREIITNFHFDWLISFAMISAICLEVAAGDWATIYTKETLGITSGWSALPYILFTAAMIYGRLNSTEIVNKYPMDLLVKRASAFGAMSFAAFFYPAALIHEKHQWLAFTLTCIAFILAGLGSSLIGPHFFNIANVRSPHPGAVVAGQIGVLNQVFLLLFKTSIAWTAQLTGSIAIAFLIPAFLLFSVRVHSKVFKTS